MTSLLDKPITATRDCRLSYGENPESLSNLGLIRYRVVTPQTDGQTDRQNSHSSQQYLPVQLSRVKISRDNVISRHG